MIKIGLVGLGRMGQNHLRVLQTLRDVQITGLFDTDAELCQKTSHLCNSKAFDSLIELAQNVDALILVSPTSRHFDQLKTIIPLVPFIFVEKPLVPTLAQSLEIEELCRIHHAQIQVGFIERFNPAVQVLKSLFSQMGLPIQVDFARMNKFSARIRDVDVVTDLMIHDLDLALYLFGNYTKVQSYGFKDEEQSVAWARAQVWHETGVISQITASRMTDKRIRQITATCKNGLIDANLLRREIEVHRQSIEHYGEDITVSARVESVDVKPQESLLLELQSFIQGCIQGQLLSIAPKPTANSSAISLATQILNQI